MFHSIWRPVEGGGGGGMGWVLPMMAYTGRLCPKGVPIYFRLQVYERVRISLAEVYKRVGICHLGL